MRRKKGEGSICFEKSCQLWRVAITGPNGKPVVKRFKHREDAVIWLAEKKVELYKGTFTEPTKMTLHEWGVEFIKTYCSTLRPSSIADHLHSLGLMKPIYNIKLAELTVLAIQNFYNDLTCASSTKVKVHRLLHTMLHKAYALGAIPRDIASLLEAPTQPKVQIDVFSEQEIKTILSYAKLNKPTWYPFLMLAFSSGMRLGELLGLRYKNIHRGFVVVETTIIAVLGKIVESPPKTSAGYRRVVLPTQITDLLGQGDPNAFVFATKSGRPIEPTNAERAWRATLERAGVRHRNFHTIRHSHASALIAKGVPIPEVASRLGHSKSSHTLNLYAHHIPTYDTQMIEMVSNITPLIK